MELETGRLYMRPYTKDLAAQVVELAGDEAVAATTFVPHPYTREVAEEWIALHKDWIDQGKAFPLAVLLKENQKLVGTMTLRVDDQHHKGELAYWIGKPYWNQGYATEAACRIMDFGFEKLKLNRIWAAAISSNPGSVKVMQKAGLSYEGTLKQDIYHWGEFKDLDLYGKIKHR